MVGGLQSNTSHQTGPAGSPGHQHCWVKMLKMSDCKSALFFCPIPSPLAFLPVCTLPPNPTQGSESGRSTPSLSTFSDGKSPSSTYVPAPRHFHVPGRPRPAAATLLHLHQCLQPSLSVFGRVCLSCKWTSGPVDPWTASTPSSSVWFSSAQTSLVQNKTENNQFINPSTNKRAVCMTPPPVRHGSAADWLHHTLIPVVQSKEYWIHEVCVISKVPSWLPAG